MKLLAFRITNFRSIVDTGWCAFSPDGVTVLVGQNESGKSSILEALATTFSQVDIDDDDCRISAPLPLISIRVHVEWDELAKGLAGEHFSDFPPEQMEVVEKFALERQNIWEVKFPWKRDASQAGGKLSCRVSIDDELLKNVLEPFEIEVEAVKHRVEAAKKEVARQKAEHDAAVKAAAENPEENTPPKTPWISPPEEKIPPFIEQSDIASALFDLAPAMTLFEQSSGLLPDRADLVLKGEEWQLAGDGSSAAGNFLLIADINLNDLVRGDMRARENILRRANAKVSADFATFWSQTIGKSEKLKLECEIANYSSDIVEKSGKPHLVFWISDGFNKLYPKQRSLGVRWFVSFYLQLKASEKLNDKNIFLLDEPGANLHSKAQADVLKLINKLGAGIGIVYSTHSPPLIEYEKLYRVLAVQRDGDGGDSPTTVIDALKLGAASRDTLSPLFAAMGVDLSHQQVVRKKNNVILEEISGFYFLKAFWNLTGQKQEAHFIAATGVDNVEPLANMFLGWGLEFVAVIDDDPHGRNVYNKLKRHMFGDDEAVARASLYKIADCKGIEDVFSKNDFKKFILPEGADYELSNSDYVKGAGLSKPILAYQFFLRLRNDGIKLNQFDAETTERVTRLTNEIASRLQEKQKK